MIDLNNISVGYKSNIPILKNISLKIQKGEVINILGPNGCGKSTLLKAILHFIPVQKGSITICGQNIRSIPRAKLAKKLAYVPQIHHGIFNYSVMDIVLMGRTASSPWYHFSKHDQQHAIHALEKVRLEHLAHRTYLELSGGERQLVLIARAIAQQSDFFIMDEPISALDYGNQFHLLSTIRELANEGFSIVLTTHHPEQAVFLGGRALLLKNGELFADGDAELIVTKNNICSLYNLPESVFINAKHL